MRLPTHRERSNRARLAARAYQGLERELRDQNLAQFAARYRLRAQHLERRALVWERTPGSLINALGSGILDLVSGYGELPGRIFLTYLAVVSIFAALYWGISQLIATGASSTACFVAPHLRWYEAIVLSFSSFHGRGFFPSAISLGDPLAIIAVFEAVIGLFIEVILIATFSRRFLGQ